jgi:hypothetical protein
MRGYHAIVALVLVLCCGNPTAPTIESLVGTWPIRTINGSAPPAIVGQANGHTLRITSDTLFLRANGAFVRSTVTADSSQSGFSIFITSVLAGDAGTFTLSGHSVTLSFQSDRSSATGVVSGTTLSLTRAGSTFVFEKL